MDFRSGFVQEAALSVPCIYQQTSPSGNSSFNDLTRNQLYFTWLPENKTVFSLKSLFSPNEGEEEMKRLVVRNEPYPCKQIVIEISLLCGSPQAKVSQLTLFGHRLA